MFLDSAKVWSIKTNPSVGRHWQATQGPVDGMDAWIDVQYMIHVIYVITSNGMDDG